MMKKILLPLLALIILLLVILTLPLFKAAGPAVVYFRLILLLLTLVISLCLFKAAFIDRRIPRWIANIATVLFSLFILFLVLEAVFMFIPRSHSADYALASKLWYARYWKPVNSLGFRDQEPDNHRPVVLFVGDSFTAGHGLKSVNDRFSDIVGNELSRQTKPYSAVNIGRPSLDSRAEYDMMMGFIYLTRIKPRKIILQYFGNDIEGAAADHGLIFEGFRPPEDMNRFLLWIGSGSYFFNYVYFLFPREYLGLSYILYLTEAYKNDRILKRHQDDLMLFVDYARQNAIELMVVMFPFLADPVMSDTMYVKEMTRFFEANGIPVIRVSELIRNMPVKDRIVNQNDTHASAALNRVIAREILKKLNEGMDQ